jgi:hypothetical protein
MLPENSMTVRRTGTAHVLVKPGRELINMEYMEAPVYRVELKLCRDFLSLDPSEFDEKVAQAKDEILSDVLGGLPELLAALERLVRYEVQVRGSEPDYLQLIEIMKTQIQEVKNVRVNRKS